MKVKPVWWVGVIAWAAYNAIIFIAWVIGDSSYLNMVGPDVAFKSLIVPLSLGALFMIIVLSSLGWWRPVMTEERRGQPGWTLWVVLLFMLGFIVLNGGATNWSALAPLHLMMLVAAGILVGFNEESLTRGVLVVAWRGSTPSETWVWFWTTFLFGLMHLPNAFFGTGLIGGVMQVGLAFLAGCGFYLIRRVSGTLLIPMALHGAWDFVNFTRLASGGELPKLAPIFQFGTYLLSIALVIVVLVADRRRSSTQQES